MKEGGLEVKGRKERKNYPPGRKRDKLPRTPKQMMSLALPSLPPPPTNPDHSKKLWARKRKKPVVTYLSPPPPVYRASSVVVANSVTL